MVLADFLTIGLSVFLGFLSALGVEYIWDTVKGSRERKKLVVELRAELSRNRAELGKAKQSPELRLRPFESAIWDGAVASGMLAGISGAPWFFEVTKAYSAIRLLTEWERMRVSAYASSPQSNTARVIDGYIDQLESWSSAVFEQAMEALDNV